MTKYPNMTRGDFVFIANTLKECKPPFMGQTRAEAASASVQWERTVARFASELDATNSGFKRDRFLKACGAED